MSDATAEHEAAHSVVARCLGVDVIRAAAGDDPGVRTRTRFGGTPAQKFAALARLAIVDLAPLAVDESREACATDVRNAERHCLRAVMEKHGLEGDDELTDELRVEAAKLIEQLHQKAAALVRENAQAIERVAQALAEGAVLREGHIDALIGET